MDACVQAKNIMENAFSQDGIPHSQVQQLFGIDMSGKYNRQRGIPGMPLGRLVYNCWITIRLQRKYKTKKIVRALYQDKMSDYFRRLIIALPQDSYYTQELKQRGFDKITWSTVQPDQQAPFLTQIHFNGD